MKKLTVSIIGDSISTYEGYNPEGYAVHYKGDVITKNEMTSVEDTWWMKVIHHLDAKLCVNNSYSGSTVTEISEYSASSQKRTSALHRLFVKPDIVLIYIGFNDYGRGEPIDDEEYPSFYPSYKAMLRRIKANYPKAKIVCGTMMTSFKRTDSNFVFPGCYRGIYFSQYNDSIKRAAEEEGALVADLKVKGYLYETIDDGAHPSKNGHSTIANAWIECLEELKGKGIK